MRDTVSMQGTVAHTLEAALWNALPRGVAVAATAVSASVPTLQGAEADAVGRMAPRRQQEFAAGRACARRALAAIGHPGATLPMNPDRSAAWPAGTCGSITHAGGYAIAAAAPSTLLAGLGIDLEDCAPLDADLIPRICTPLEMARQDGPDLPAGTWPRVVFSAKESLYKCVHAHVGRFIEFGEIEVDRGLGGTLAFAPAADPTGLRLVAAVAGRYRLAGGFIVTMAWLAPEVRAAP